MKVLCLSDSDTRMKWTTAVAAALVSESARAARSKLGLDGEQIEVDVASFEVETQPTERQLHEIGVVGPHLVVDDDQLAELALGGYDVMIVNTIGSRLHRVTELLRGVSVGAARRPVLVTGYAGVVYEKHVEGAIWRSGADVICCNSQLDHERFTEIYQALGVSTDGLVRAGLGVVQPSQDSPGTSAVDRAIPLAEPREISTLTFAVQPDVPRRRDDRMYLLERLAAYARAHPNRSVIVKLRSRPDEATTHRERYHFEELYRTRLVDRPPNLSFEYGLMSKVLARTDLLVTVSSTAALEAVGAGVPVAILTDVGVGETLGNHYFIGSGLLSSMNQIMQDKLPVADSDWLRRNGFDPADRLGNVVDRVMELHRRQLDDGAALPVPPSFVSDDMTPRLAQVALRTIEPGATVVPGRVRQLARTMLPRRTRRLARQLELRLERGVAAWRS